MRKALFILGQMSDDDAAWMARVGRRRTLAPSEALIRQGEPLSELLLILSGHVRVLVNGRPVAELGTGEMLGEMALIDSSPPAATVAAIDDVFVLSIPRRLIEERTRTDHAFAARFYRALAVFLSDRLRQMNRQVAGGDEPPRLEDEVELDDTVLDSIHLAGKRFELIIRQLAQG